MATNGWNHNPAPLIVPPEVYAAAINDEKMFEQPPPSYEQVIGLNPVIGPEPVEYNLQYTVVPVHLNKKDSTAMVCPYCFKQMRTRLDYVYPDWVSCLSCLLCLTGGCLCCCLIPCLIFEPKYVEHYCSECSQYIGVAPEMNPLLKHKAAKLRSLDQ